MRQFFSQLSADQDAVTVVGSQILPGDQTLANRIVEARCRVDAGDAHAERVIDRVQEAAGVERRRNRGHALDLGRACQQVVAIIQQVLPFQRGFFHIVAFGPHLNVASVQHDGAGDCAVKHARDHAVDQE